MFDYLNGLRLVVKRRNICIDSGIFRCHWCFTSFLLVLFSLIITARQYVGSPIECHSATKLPATLLNSYCWVQSTFIVPQACNQRLGSEVPYPCIDNTRGREVKKYAYYQWVGTVLLIQALLFHLPYHLWKMWENGLIKALTCGLRVTVMGERELAKKRDIVIEYIHNHLGCHKRYALKYFMCELICLVNLVGQLWATNKFFDGQFIRYGLDVIQYTSSSVSGHFWANGGPLDLTRHLRALGGAARSQLQQQQHHDASPVPSGVQHQSNTTLSHVIASDNKQAAANSKIHLLSRDGSNQEQQQQPAVDPMTFIFPRMTKCTYYDYGSSGDIQKHDALCLLPLNIINEKVYIAVWFWFVLLLALTLLVLLYRLWAIASVRVRCKGLISRCKLSNELDIEIICRHCDVGDWFLFYMVADNLDPLLMREIIASVANKIREHLELKQKLFPAAAGNTQDSAELLKEREASAFGCSWLRVAQGSRPNDDGDNTEHQSTGSGGPLIGKLRKRFYNKRHWSAELGPAELRQQLFAAAAAAASGSHSPLRQPATNPDLPAYHNHGQQPTDGSLQFSGLAPPIQQQPARYDDDTAATAAALMVSAPPASEMPGAEASPQRRRLHRLDSNSSTMSAASDSDSFVMDMRPPSASGRLSTARRESRHEPLSQRTSYRAGARFRQLRKHLLW